MTTPLPLEPIETASRDELTALQLERLKWSLRHAYDHSPVYRRKFDDAGVHPDDLKALDGPLTPMGAVRAASKDSGVPEWSGKWLGTPPDVQYKRGSRYPDPFANDKPVATITARASISPSPASSSARTGPRHSRPTTSRASTISAPKRVTCAIARWARSEPLRPFGKPR